MRILWQDLRYGARILMKNPGFTLIAVITLALGIGATTAIFSVVNAVLLRALPYHEPERLVLLDNAYLNLMDARSPQSAFVWRDQTQSFEQVAAYGDFDGGVNLTGAGDAQRVEATEVSANFFSTLGVNAILGRVFTAEQERPENLQVALISQGLWRRLYAGNAEAIGQTLRLNGQPFTIIGVTSAELQFPRKSDVWVPLRLTLEDRVFTSPTISHKIFARLKNGVTLSQANAEMQSLSQQVKLRKAVEVLPLRESLIKQHRRQMLMLLAAVGFVLLIACANVANLLLARAAARTRELAVRAALGAGRWRLMRQSLTEALLIAGLGGALGLLLAIWLRDLLVAISPPELTRLTEVTLNGRALGFNLALALLTGLLAGALPAWQSSKVDLITALKNGSPGLVGGRAFQLKGALVVGEIALSLILLIGAGLLLRSFVSVLSLNPGFERANILTVSLTLPRSSYDGRAKISAFYQQLLERLQATPGVVAAGTTNKMPLSRENVFGLLFEVVGRQKQEPFDQRFAIFLSVSPGYFRAMGIPLLQGRYFTSADNEQAQPVIIINDRMAKRLFPNGDALGQQIKLPHEKAGREIVGIVSAVRSLSLEDDTQKEMYLPFLQGGSRPTSIAIRTLNDPHAIVGAVRAAVQSMDKDLPLYDIKTVEQRVSEAMAKRRFSMLLMGGFAVLALSLAAIGVYGVMSYSLTRRTRELAVRMALGAQSSDVLKLALKQGLLIALSGVALGLPAALALTRLMRGLLFGVSASDPLTFALIPLLFVFVALLACWIPARRATKVDPMISLRCE